jgi:hypothetical protein
VTVPASDNSAFLVNDDERGLHQYYEKWLEELAPYNLTFVVS